MSEETDKEKITETEEILRLNAAIGILFLYLSEIRSTATKLKEAEIQHPKLNTHNTVLVWRDEFNNFIETVYKIVDSDMNIRAVFDNKEFTMKEAHEVMSEIKKHIKD